MKQYDAMIVDPPWAYKQYRDTANGSSKAAYSRRTGRDMAKEQMTVEDIAAIPIRDWAAKNCVVAIWTTGPMLAQGEFDRLRRLWGLTGKTMVPWLKNAPSSQDLATGTGIWVQGNAEYLVFCCFGKPTGFYSKDPETPDRRGNLGVLVEALDVDNDLAPTTIFWPRNSEQQEGVVWIEDGVVLVSPKAKTHSRKPLLLHEYLESFGEKRCLELFATQDRDGWDCYGYEVGYELGPWGVRRVQEDIA